MTVLERIREMDAYELASLLWAVAEYERRKIFARLRKAGVKAELVSAPALDIATIVESLLKEIDDAS